MIKDDPGGRDGLHHACDDYDKMVLGDSGMESVFEWSSSKKGEERRGATGGGDGVHVMTGPIFVEGAEPGDILRSRSST